MKRKKYQAEIVGKTGDSTLDKTAQTGKNIRNIPNVCITNNTDEGAADGAWVLQGNRTEGIFRLRRIGKRAYPQFFFGLRRFRKKVLHFFSRLGRNEGAQLLFWACGEKCCWSRIAYWAGRNKPHRGHCAKRPFRPKCCARTTGQQHINALSVTKVVSYLYPLNSSRWFRVTSTT